MEPRHDQDVAFEHRPYIEERDDLVGLEHDVGQLAASRDPAEQAAGIESVGHGDHHAGWCPCRRSTRRTTGRQCSA